MKRAGGQNARSFFLFPPGYYDAGSTGSDNERDDPPRAAVRRSRLGLDRLSGGLRGRDRLRRGRGRRALLDLQSGGRFGFRIFAQLADALLLPFLAGGSLAGDCPVSKGVLALFRGDRGAEGIFLLVLRFGDCPLRHTAGAVAPGGYVAVSLAAGLTLCPPEAGRRAAGVPRGGDRRAGGELCVAILAVCIAGVAVLRAGGCHRVADLLIAGVVVGVKNAPFVFIRLRSLVVAAAAVLVVHRLRDTGGRRRKVHVARPEKMIAIMGFPFRAVEAPNPVGFRVPSYLRVKRPVPARGKGMPAVVLPAAIGARARRDAGRAAAAAVCRIDRAAAIALAGALVRLIVAAGRPLAPVVAELAVFSAASLAGFARGAGGRFGAASMFKYTTIISRTARALLFIPATHTFNNCPMEHWVRRTADRGGNEPFDQEIAFPVAAFTLGINRPL